MPSHKSGGWRRSRIDKLRTAIANIPNTDTTSYMTNKPTERVLLEEEIKGYFSPVFLRQLLAASRSNRKPYVHISQKIFGCNSLQFPKLSGFFPNCVEFSGYWRRFSASSWVILLIATSWYINRLKTKLVPDNQPKMILAWGSKRKNMWHGTTYSL